MLEILAIAVSQLKYGLGQVLGPYGWVAVTSFVVSAVATPLLRALAQRLGFVDKPDGHLKPHQRPIAYLGGVAVYLGWLAGLAVLLPVVQTGRDWMLGLGMAGGVVMVVGLADDLLDIKPVVKILGQVAAAGILLHFGIGRDIILVVVKSVAVFVPGLDCPQWLVLVLSVPVTVLLVVGASNATNLLDGMDGLCSGVTGIISVMFFILATHLAMFAYSQEHDPVRLVASLSMAGAVAGFLPYNFSPATIFLGDAGSMLMGLFAAAMMLMFGERGILKWVLGAMMIFGLPILDTALALIRRIRLGRPIFGGDRSHLYDQLVDRGLSVKQTVGISYGLSVFYGLVGLAIILMRTRYAVGLYVVVVVATFYLCHRWGFLRPSGGSPGEEGKAAGAESSPARAPG